MVYLAEIPTIIDPSATKKYPSATKKYPSATKKLYFFSRIVGILVTCGFCVYVREYPFVLVCRCMCIQREYQFFKEKWRSQTFSKKIGVQRRFQRKLTFMDVLKTNGVHTVSKKVGVHRRFESPNASFREV